jgi:SCY1-like protein 2
MTLTDDKLGLTKEVIATKLLPFLFPLSIENGLTLNQYQVIMNLIRQMIAKVEDEHKVKLDQLNSLQNEQRSALQISMSENMQTKSDQLIPSPASAYSETDDMFAVLGMGSYVQKKDTGNIATEMMVASQQVNASAASLPVTGAGNFN